MKEGVGCGVWGVGCGVWGVGCGGRINKSNLLTPDDRLLTPAENSQFYWAVQKKLLFLNKIT
ncbi:hypothetical protein RVR34_12415 [Microcystis aeruginosa FBCC-A68]|uniref:hypothetical protein n=1 Tax=Microcystis aeruginosa TaxID=1126 RepID=UPI001481D66D|nr:hypothetical protein [Microcystis aeruginosa]